ncbi:MAG: PHP domain-containing protein [Desulfotomaculum sp.]|nr:PHP domain-containing protein [Desulfotomaculum sp.]
MSADLHIHTNFSDGTDTPVEIITKALLLGLKTIAITDHDIMDGLVGAWQAAQGKKIEVLAGVEMSCYYDRREIHILGYFAEMNNAELIATLDEMCKFRISRAKLIIDKLRTMGLDIEWSKVQRISGSGSVGRPHIADALVEKGIVSSREAAFKKYIGVGCPAYIPYEKMCPAKAIKLISRAKGVAVLAHPAISKCADILPELIEYNLKGIEVWHPGHTWLQQEYYFRQTQKWHLIPTGGSDYHGEKHKFCNRLGAATAPSSSVNRIKDYF